MHRKIRVGGTYDDQTVTEVWGGNQVLNVGWTTPEWSSAKGAVKVVFTDAFSAVKPTSLYKWFYSFQELKAIKGLENLNTVDVTNMNATFANCKSLICLDVNSFDVSKVTNTTTMFSNCSSLETIFCNYVWSNVSNHETSDGMFFGCVKLKGAVEYDGAKVDGNMATYTQGYFTKTENKVLVLSDAADNSAVISKFDGIEGVKVTLGRTLSKDDKWNTICLPFDLTIEDSPLAGADVRKLTEATFSEGTLTLNFTEGSLTKMKAGTPYIIKWGNDTETPTLTNLEFTNMTIDAEKHDVSFDFDEEETTGITFIGTYTPVAIASDGDNTKLYIGDGNTLYWPNNEMTIGSQRAYFQLKGLEASTPTQSPTIRAFVLDFGDDSNGISSLDYGQRMMDNDGWYTLDGRKIVNRTREALGSSKKSVNRKLPKGLYIHGGRKVVVH